MARVRAGTTQMLVLRGEEGIGKAALLDYLEGKATGCRVVRVAGVESERGLAFAGLHQLCSPILDHLDELPEPQRRALATAFGVCAGDPPDRFVVGMAVIGLLRAAAADVPLVCIVKDAQWFDEASAQVVGFVARRLMEGPVAFAVVVAISICQGDDGPDLSGVPELVVAGLDEGAARDLLRSSVLGPLDEEVQARIATEARGNPRTLLEATIGHGPDELAGGFGVPRFTMPVRVEQTFLRRLAPLPSATRLLLLLAAAEPTGDAVLLWAAANQLGISAGAAAPAVATQLVELDGRVKFCHPLIRSIIYEAASASERQRVHRALADVTDPATDPDRRAWHRAHGAPNSDDAAADELERTVERARVRGGLPAASAFRARAAELTVDPDRRARRALAAAELNHQTGSWGAARRLLAMAQAQQLDEAHSARVQLLRARLTARSDRSGDTSHLLLEAAERLAPGQSQLAQQAYGEAFEAVLAAGRLGSPDGHVALAVRAASGLKSSDASWLLLEGAAVLACEGHAAGAPLVKRALQSFEDDKQQRTADSPHWLPLACRMAQEVWDDRKWQAMSSSLIEFAREVGALTLLPNALNCGAVIRLLSSGCGAAIAMADEAVAVGLATHHDVGPYGRLMCAAWRGSLVETKGLVDEATARLIARGEGVWLTAAHVASAVVNNSLGHYGDALDAAEHGSDCPEELGLTTWCSVELIEAAVRVGAPDRAANALRRLEVSTNASATDWGLGVMDRSRALLHQGDAAEHFYQAAIARLSRTLVRAELGRAHLLYGEWLRREGRRVDAREQLRTAHEILAEMGFDGFAERARRELVSTGGAPRKRKVDTVGVLTAQESQVARMAREGRTNAEIGTELYISSRTVEWHMRNVFLKLGIRSRYELAEAMPA